MRKFWVSILTGLLAISLVACNTAPTASGSQKNPDATRQADIVVIGAGGAGMTAAIQAVQNGATNVVVLEKMSMTGGNTTRATGGLNAANTTYQAKKGIKDSIELFVQDTLTGGKNINNQALVKVMAENSANAVDWVNAIGGDLSVVAMFAGASVERIHRPADTSAVGPMLVKTLNNKLEELNVPVLLDTKAERILVDKSGAVCGVVATNKDGSSFTINCKSVVLATGGFSANAEMVVKNNPALAGFDTTNAAGATGDGITMAEELGVAFVDMEQIQTHPTVNPETKIMYTEGVRGNGGILVNKEGKRFVNELETRDVVSAAILQQPDQVCYLIFDDAVRSSLSAIESYIKVGIVTEAQTIEALGEAIGIDGQTLASTLTAYSQYQAAGADADFARENMACPLNQPKYYAALCAPAVHHTMGGVVIDTHAQVLKTDGSVLPGLFAAGEVTGGIHGANRLGGNAVTDIVVFGRIAGASAEDYVLSHGGHTAPQSQSPSSEASAPVAQGKYTDGVYEGTGTGHNGPITVEVTVENGNITSIQLKEHEETPGIYEAAERDVVTNIIATQTCEVDTVTSATFTSNGIIEAVSNALNK